MKYFLINKNEERLNLDNPPGEILDNIHTEITRPGNNCIFNKQRKDRSELLFYLESGLENTVGHAVSVSMAITVLGVVVFIRKEHHVDLNIKS